MCAFQTGVAEKLKMLVKTSATELKFTVEQLENKLRQFLDLQIHVVEALC